MEVFSLYAGFHASAGELGRQIVRFRNPRFSFEILRILLPVMVKNAGGVTVQFQEEELVLGKNLALKTAPDALAVGIQHQQAHGRCSTKMAGRRNPRGIHRNTVFFSE